MIVVFCSQVAGRQPVLAMGLCWGYMLGQGSLTVASLCMRAYQKPPPPPFFLGDCLVWEGMMDGWVGGLEQREDCFALYV